MEIYKMEGLNSVIKYGIFKEKVFQKHLDDYGEKSAKDILNNSTKILKRAIDQSNDIRKTSNVLLVGKIQSGKTSNLEMISALSFDNRYNVLVIYGGYDNHLLRQSAKRFKDTFDINDKNEETPYLITTEIENFDFFTDDFLDDAIKLNRPVIFVSLKRPQALEKVNEALKRIRKTKYKSIIIDDEGDQASLNTKKDKVEEASATYNQIKIMKKNMNNPIYFSVTATPQANIFQPDLSVLKPDSIMLIPPASSYTGADTFHLIDDNIYLVASEDIRNIENEELTPSLKNAINYYLISSAIMYDMNMMDSDMIVHAYREVNGHLLLYGIINTYIENLIDCIDNGDQDFNIFLKQLMDTYTEKLFDSSIITNYPWNDHLVNNIKKVIKRTRVIQHNSQNGLAEDEIKYYKHKIYIGGDLLQRGITFKHLVTTFFTRWAVKGNMDTSLQRARWFGYRESYIKLCKVFTTKTIKMEFSNLATIENDLWNQFNLVEEGELDINQIVVDAEQTSLNPTRKNVTEYKKVSFAKKWSNQVYASFDENIINKNNSLFEELISILSFRNSSIGRIDGNVSTRFACIEGESFIDFVKKTDYIFEQSPFSKKDISRLFTGEKVCIQLMYGEQSPNYRKRSFLDGKISALQQGADTTNVEKQHYLGDSSVIVDKDAICVQVFRVVPKNDDGTIELKKLQYMYSIHFSSRHIVFAKRN
ncbi:MAG: Z1 domain-containing protein [Candidatus Cloacimonetes bacterium]|nr:Z1 domain-containing protein [Candidatus Cloacimonadota bacterium]